MIKHMFVFIILLAAVLAPEPSETVRYVEVNFGHLHYSQYVFLLGCLVIVLVIRHYVKVMEVSVPNSVFSILIGIIWGYAAIEINLLHSSTKIFNLIMMNAEDLYLPIIVFGTAFCTDAHAFMKSLPQILIISIPLFLINGLMCGIFMGFVIDPQWETADGIFFGMIVNAAYPLDVLRCLKETNQTKHVIVLLEGELIVGTTMSVFIYKFIKYTLQGWIVHWYQYVMGVIRLLFMNLPLSYLLGFVASFLLRINYQDTLSLSLVTFITCFSSYYFIRSLTTIGATGAVISGITMALERTTLPSEMEKAITDLWKVIVTLLNATVFLMIGAMTPYLMMRKFTIDVYALVFVTFLIANIGRFISFFLFSPILSRIGYGMTFKNMIICIWVGLKHPLSLSMAADVFGVFSKDIRKFHLFYLHTISVYLLYLFINASFLPILLKALGLTELSASKQLNMNNCVKYILQGRDRTIAILKMDRFLSDANWPLVMSTTAFRHPYRKKASKILDEEDSEDEEDPFIGNRFSVCPDCKTRVPNEPTQKEFKDMTKEAKMRLLKLRKIFYSRRYECGMLTKDGARVAHQSIEVAMDSEYKQIEIEGLVAMFSKEFRFYRFLQRRFTTFLRLSEKDLKPPKTPLRIFCHHLLKHIIYQIFMYVLHASNMIVAIYHLVYHHMEDHVTSNVIFSLNLIILVLFLITSGIYILGHAQESICKDGFRKYFSSVWCILNYIMICDLTLETIRRSIEINLRNSGQKKHEQEETGPHRIILHILLAVRLIGILYFFQVIRYYKNLGIRIVTFLDMKIDKYRLMAFELGRNFICGEEELTENIINVVDNDKIRKAVKEKIQNDLLEVTRAFGIAEKERPWVAVTVKTKLAITTVLKAIKDDLLELKMSGWVDDFEYSKLNKSLAERYRFVRTIETVEPLSPIIQFKEVSWMGTDDTIVSFLYSNATTKKFDPGDIIYREGDMIEGIYILISGVLISSYVPQKVTVDKLNEAGILPTIDYVSPTNFYDKREECIIPGNTIGELSILTERPSDCTVTAETHSQVFVLRREVLKQAMEMDPDPINGLESRMWKRICYWIALPLLIRAPPYHSHTYENVKYVIDRAFVPNISNYKVFIVSEMMEDIILIEGVAVDLHTRDVYTGPCYIQRSVQKLILPKSSSLNMELEVETKLMVIPAKDFDEYELMMNEEKSCELVSYSSTRCLRHFVRNRMLKSKSGTKKKKIVKSSGSKQTRNKITFGQPENNPA